MKKEFRTKNLLSQFALSPRFVETYDCVLLADAGPEHIPTSNPGSKEERQKTEYLVNRRDLWELFEVPPPEPSPQLLCDAGDMIKEIWQNKLKAEFPFRQFIVQFEYAPPVCDISFFQALDWQLAIEEQVKSEKGSSRTDWRPKMVRSMAVQPSKPKIK